MHPTRILLLTLALVLGVTACEDDSTGPEPLLPVPAHLYVAQSIDDALLPAHVHTTPPIGEEQQVYQVWVTYDTLRVFWNGRYQRRTRLETRRLDGTPVGNTIRSDHGSWRSQGTTYHFMSSVYESLWFDTKRGDGGAAMLSDQDIVGDDDSPQRRVLYTRR